LSRWLASGAGGDRVQQRAGLLAGGHDDDADLRLGVAQLVEHREAAEVGHAEVEDHDVGLQVGGDVQRLLPILRLGDDLDARILVESPYDALADERKIVSDDDADLHDCQAPCLV
jgi:hypothetical protein